MIVQICLLTSLTKADLMAMCSTAEIQFYYSVHASLIRSIGKPLSASPVYFTSLADFNAFQDKLQMSPEKFLVLLGAQYTSLKDATGREIIVPHVAVRNLAGLVQLSLRASKKTAIEGKVKTGLSEASVGLAQQAMGNSVMHKVQTNLYRIPKMLRAEVQKAVFSYLRGNAPQLGKAAQYPHILTMLSSPEMQNLRCACKSIAGTSFEEAVIVYKVDAFDLSYLLAQEKKDDPLAKLKKIKK